LRNLSLLCTILLICVSCSQPASFKLKSGIEGHQKNFDVYQNNSLIYHISINETGSDIETQSNFILTALSNFNLIKQRSPAYTEEIAGTTNNYMMFFRIGDSYLSGINNKLIRYGLIEMEWMKLVAVSENNTDKLSMSLQGEKYNRVRIDDIRQTIQAYRLQDNELEQFLPYVVNYLLKEIFFVSLQEILDRPERYLNSADMESIFSQIVVLPEITLFTDYLVKKFGLKKVLELGCTDFSKDKWNKILKEPVNETEADYTKMMENYSFNGIYNDKAFDEELNSYLEMYNKMTKPTLFRK
jgi:hypothetical protein